MQDRPTDKQPSGSSGSQPVSAYGSTVATLWPAASPRGEPRRLLPRSLTNVRGLQVLTKHTKGSHALGHKHTHTHAHTRNSWRVGPPVAQAARPGGACSTEAACRDSTTAACHSTAAAVVTVTAAECRPKARLLVMLAAMAAGTSQTSLATCAAAACAWNADDSAWTLEACWGCSSSESGNSNTQTRPELPHRGVGNHQQGQGPNTRSDTPSKPQQQAASPTRVRLLLPAKQQDANTVQGIDTDSLSLSISSACKA